MGLTKQEIGDLSLYLQQLPDINDVRQHSSQETVKALSKDILALQKRGYTLSQISDALKAGGLTIATPTLKSYVQRARKPAIKKSKTVPALTTSGVASTEMQTEVAAQSHGR
jgi:hypothetical protein